MSGLHAQKILILDFGSQYTQLIARRVRELGVYCELHPYDMSESAMSDFAPQGIILSGGPESSSASCAPRIPSLVFELGCPVLGICYGMQAMALHFGGQVVSGEKREFGLAKLHLQQSSALLVDLIDGIDESSIGTLEVWMSHADAVSVLPSDFNVIAHTESAAFAVISHQEQPWYGLQFHPEVTHTPCGAQLLANFVRTICACEQRWTAENIIEDSLQTIRERVGNSRVILGLSGGVDSSVVACLLHKAIGKQLSCVFVDTGLLRLNEAKEVIATFGQHIGLDLIHVDARQQFMQALQGVCCPEEKRKIVGKVFVDVFQAQAQKLDDAVWLAQGTIYPDVIESAASSTGKAKLIKSHHNVGGLPETLNLKLLEPLRELFKDEVRSIGLKLGLPHELIYRHPFPGPGLTVRILGEVKPEFIPLLQQADAIFISELRAHQLYDEVSQAFAVFLPVKSVAVMGDGRCYDYVIALRAVTTVDFMTAHWAELPHAFLQWVANRIINEVAGISRVVYDISGKPPATIEWE